MAAQLTTIKANWRQGPPLARKLPESGL